MLSRSNAWSRQERSPRRFSNGHDPVGIPAGSLAVAQGTGCGLLIGYVEAHSRQEPSRIFWLESASAEEADRYTNFDAQHGVVQIQFFQFLLE